MVPFSQQRYDLSELNMPQEYIRLCPVCETENPAANSVCVCGASLVAVDYSLKAAPAADDESAPVEIPPSPPLVKEGMARAEPNVCPFPDCAQPNPPGETRCLYCNRPLLATSPIGAPSGESWRYPLPSALRAAYRLVEALPAQGSEADVLLVESLESREKRIVKLYRKGIRPDAELLQRVAGAAQPHVVRLYEFGESDGYAYELMEYCAHGSLRGLLEAGLLSRERIRWIVREIGAAIAEIHARRILHRDLKPENILLRTLEPLDLVLSDFGTASLRDATLLFTGAVHTAKYAAPEALSGVLDEKSDWWALGMMTLEAAAGRHPFAGLSEQVINHRLATASVDVRSVFDDDLRKLCRGLLLRDPQRRWGRNEVARWLNNDATLPDPGDDIRPAGTVTPYRIGAAQCATAGELALALAKNWDDALKDLRRGAIAAWIDKQLHDHNLLRRLADIMEERGVSDDLRLLRFLLAAAPDMPAVWRRQPLSRATLLAAARLSLEKNEAALDWLESLIAEPVLAACGAAGKADLQAVDAGWRGYWQRYCEFWETAHHAEETWRTTPKSLNNEAAGAYLNFDDAVYSRPLRIALPARRGQNARLLLALFDPAFVENQRSRIIAATGEIAGYCEWFEALGDTARLDPGALLAAETLLPFAVEDAAAEKDRRGESERSREMNLRLIRTRLESSLNEIADNLANHGLRPDNLGDLRQALDRFGEIASWALGFGYSGADYQALREVIERLLRFALQLEQMLNRLEHAERINAIFFQPYRLGLAVAILASVYSALPSAWPVWLLGAGVAGFLGWRLRIVGKERRRVAEAQQRFERQVATFLGRGS
ncbi:MAG: serine/threonine-protein kinase [Sulfuricella sp.]|nr:serine/threonine-protein kinase [Sulfuricella sp.]